MRPRELTLRGFRSYRDEVTFDLRGRHLIGIVGPIGAGKSSILDGVAFALFGKTPRVQRETKSLIHQLSDAAHVRLTFEVQGQLWQVTRALKRKGQGQVQLRRLSDDTPDAVPLETVVMDRAVRDRIETLLGMDFETFGRSVLLAQNRFAEFLLATDAPRNAVLKGVFGYERFDAALAAAREHVARGEATVAALDVDGTKLLQARATLDAARAEAATADARRDRLASLRPQIEQLDGEAVAEEARRLHAAEALVRIGRAADTLPAPPVLEDGLRATEVAEAAVQRATQAVAQAETTRREAEAARETSAAQIGDLQAFADLVAQLHAQADAVTALTSAATSAALAGEAAEAAAALARIDDDDASASLAEATAAREAAAAALEAADAALHTARHAEMAAELRGGLVAGEPCPVCAQVVTAAPKAAKAAGVRRAERERTAAATRHDAAVQTRDRGAVVAANAAATAAAAETERDRLVAASAEADTATRLAETTLAATQSTLVDRLGQGDPIALLDERKGALLAAETAARDAADAERAARDDLDGCRRAAADAAAVLVRIREQLAGAWGALDEDPGKAPTDAATIRAMFGRLTSLIAERAETATVQEAASARALQDLARQRAALLADASLPADADVLQAWTETQVLAAAAQERVRVLEEIVAAGADLDARLEAARQRLAVARRLRDDLQPSRFLAWLLGEERAALAELASTHFEELTDGDYRFSDDDTFRIVDVNAGGAVRDPDSLSGGETFLASLALALALADMVTRGGGRLDSFFLDEGFGSLDPEHIERAMRGIEHLVHEGDRLVIVVSHVEQMRELLEDLIVLDKDDAAGTTRVVAGAAGAVIGRSGDDFGRGSAERTTTGDH